MAKLRSGGNATAVKPVAATKNQGKSNKVTKVNGKASAVKPIAGKNRQAQGNDNTANAHRARSASSDEDIVMIEVDELFKAAGAVQLAKRKADEALLQVIMIEIQARRAAEALMPPRPKGYLDCLPTEMIEHIGEFLDDGDNSDKDLANFALTCRSIYAAIGHRHCGLWFKRFSKRFEVMPDLARGPELVCEYKERQTVIRKGTEIVTGMKKWELPGVELIKTLILESFGSAVEGNAMEKPHSKNLDLIWQIALKTRILANIQRYILTDRSVNTHNSMKYVSATNREVQVVQLVLAHMFLRPVAPQPFGVEYSQMVIYGHPHDYPMFMHRKLNIELLLFILNFFQYHMSDKSQSTLRQQMETNNLGSPKAWDRQLKNGLAKLGKRWNGAYAQIPDADNAVPAIREAFPGYDVLTSPDTIVTGSLELDVDSPLPIWPTVFQDHLLSIPPRTTARGPCEVGKDYHQFSSRPGQDAHDLVVGVLHALPPQNGIPGFQRATFMCTGNRDKLYDDERELIEDAGRQATISNMNCPITAHEAIVLPGGKIMVGRWWTPQETPEDELAGTMHGDYKWERCNMGPFIFWLDEEEEEEEEEEEAEAEA